MLAECMAVLLWQCWPTLCCTVWGQKRRSGKHASRVCSGQTWGHFLLSQRLKNLTDAREVMCAAAGKNSTRPPPLSFSIQRHFFSERSSQLCSDECCHRKAHRVWIWPAAILYPVWSLPLLPCVCVRSLLLTAHSKNMHICLSGSSEHTPGAVGFLNLFVWLRHELTSPVAPS